MADFIQVNVITDAGKAAIANALLTATAVDLTEFAVGSGDVTGIGDLEAQTALVAEEHRGAITAAEVDPEVPGIVTVEFNIPAPVGGFTMTEWGLFDAEENLFAIGNYPASFKATDTTDATVRVRLVIGNTEAINLVIDPTVAIASRKYVDDKILAAHGSVVVYGALFDAAVTDGKPVRYNSGDQTYYLALADGTANNVAEGIADVTNEQVIKFGATRPGLITGLTAGVRYFLSDAVAGDMVTVAPDDAIKMGHAFSPTVFFVDIDKGAPDAETAGEAFTAGDAGPNYDVTLDQAMTVAFANVGTANTVYSFYIRFTQDGTGGWPLNLPAGSGWSYGEVPPISTDPNVMHKIAIETWDGGASGEVSYVGGEYA